MAMSAADQWIINEFVLIKIG